jgi:Cu2+-exporting ATPase
MMVSCFHCGEIVPKGINYSVIIETINQPMCCLGCHSVATTIIDNNLTEYYRFRTEPAQKGQPLVPQQLKQNQLLDDDALQDEFTYKTEHYRETILTIDGISCAACAWLIEMQLSKVVGIIAINVNATTQRATVRWDNEQIKLSHILNKVDKVGYQALPFKASQVEESNQKTSKTFIKRLGISGILMMQILMIATGLYFGTFSDMSVVNRMYLRWVSFFLTLPIVTYGAFPFYLGAIKALQVKRLSMDVPVSIAIILAFSASSWATYTQQGEVYFESVSMFTFLLLIGKFLEFRARLRAAETSANLLKLMPMTATIILNQVERLISAKKLKAFDMVIVKPGEVIPADGVIISGKSQLNESMLTGEQLPINKSIGESVFAGTINSDGNLTVEVKKENRHSFLSQLIRLSESSQTHKPKLAQLSDKIAQYFVGIILLAAIFTALYWQQHLPEQAFWITLSVLVATCPCALSLATPTALTCATVKLNREGIMVKSSHVMETTPHIDCVAFDKTGTLTTGDFVINKVIVLDTNQSKSQLLAISAALESHSEHPLAKAFMSYRNFNMNVSNAVVESGAGVIGEYKQHSYKIGKPSWLLSENNLAKYDDAQCVLIEDERLIAVFYLQDNIRDDALSLLSYFKEQHIDTMMISGDNQSGCDNVQAILNLNTVYSGLSAQDKMAIIKVKQKNHTVAMLGDGVNDTPVFGTAHVSIAMGGGTDIAKNGADVILLNNKLSTVKTLKVVAQKTKQIIWQNYLWAFGYNAIILPLAISGHITPYMAVIGMSASSILVVSNSLRLLK